MMLLSSVSVSLVCTSAAFHPSGLSPIKPSFDVTLFSLSALWTCRCLRALAQGLSFSASTSLVCTCRAFHPFGVLAMKPSFNASHFNRSVLWTCRCSRALGNSAFGACAHLSSVHLSSLPSFRSIGSHAFCDCKSLQSLSFADLPLLESIDDMAFRSVCESLQCGPLHSSISPNCWSMRFL